MNRYAIVVALSAAVALAGCGLENVSNPTRGVPTVRQPDVKASWMKAAAQKQRLIYISNVGTNDVYVYSFDQRLIVGELTGFDGPHGMCTDSHGNVYITNTLSSNILEYAHAGTKPIYTFSDPGENPVDCEIGRFGDLVVANESTTSGGPGGLSFFQGTTLAKKISFTRLPNVTSVGYLPAVGFDFVTGMNAKGAPQYAKFRFALNLLPTPFASPGSVRYSGIGKYMAVGDQKGTVTLVHGTTVLTTIQLSGLCSAGQFSITKRFIFVPDPCGARVFIYPFPAGGDAFYQIGGQNEPVGTAISEDGLRGP